MATKKQKIQQELSWKLRMVMGARGNLYPRERELPVEIQSLLHSTCIDLKAIETKLRTALDNIK